MTVLIVDDHEDFRRFMAGQLDGDGFEIAGEAPDGQSGLDEAARLQPDVVLLDVQLPGIDGFEVAQRLAATRSPPQVVLTSGRHASDYGQRVERAPVRGFIRKDELTPEGLAALVAT